MNRDFRRYTFKAEQVRSSHMTAVVVVVARSQEDAEGEAERILEEDDGIWEEEEAWPESGPELTLEEEVEATPEEIVEALEMALGEEEAEALAQRVRADRERRQEILEEIRRALPPDKLSLLDDLVAPGEWEEVQLDIGQEPKEVEE